MGNMCCGSEDLNRGIVTAPQRDLSQSSAAAQSDKGSHGDGNKQRLSKNNTVDREDYDGKLKHDIQKHVVVMTPQEQKLAEQEEKEQKEAEKVQEAEQNQPASDNDQEDLILALNKEQFEEIAEQEEAVNILAKEPSKSGYRKGNNVIGNDKVELTIKNTDPFAENVSIVTNYTSDAKTAVFDQGAYAKRFANDKQIKNNFLAWIYHIGEIEVGNCIVTNKGSSNQSKDCYFMFHSIAPTYAEITKDSCCQMLQQCVVNCLETANTLGVQSISLPLISCDQDFGFPAKEASMAIMAAIKVWIDHQEEEDVVCLNDIRLCIESKTEYNIAIMKFKTLFEHLKVKVD